MLVAVTGNPLTLHIDSGPQGHPIAGWLRDGCGEERQFTGWLSLLSLLEQARLKQASDAEDSPAEVSR